VTEVEFHTGVADHLGFACRLLRKAYRRGLRVLVTAPAAVLAELDRELWTFDERDFLPHVRLPGAAAALAARTPIWLASHADLEGAPRVLVNLGAQAPADPAALERLIEIVGPLPADAEGARERWRCYKAAGLRVVHHAGSVARD
jgi:DNA polymerase-3 subunit chi